MIYGVTLPLGRPFITACIGGIGGAVIGLIGNIGAIAIGPSGAALIPLISRWQMVWLRPWIISRLCGRILSYFSFRDS